MDSSMSSSASPKRSKASSKTSENDTSQGGDEWVQSVRQATARRSSSNGDIKSTVKSSRSSNNNGNRTSGNDQNGRGERSYDKKAFRKSIRRAAALICLPLTLAFLFIFFKDYVLTGLSSSDSPPVFAAKSTSSDSTDPSLDGARVLVTPVEVDCADKSDALRSLTCRKPPGHDLILTAQDLEEPFELNDCNIWTRDCRKRMRMIAYHKKVFDES